MLCPRTFDEVFPKDLAPKVLEPAEVGPTWMHGRPENVSRIANPKPIPKLQQKPPTPEEKRRRRKADTP